MSMVTVGVSDVSSISMYQWCQFVSVSVSKCQYVSVLSVVSVCVNTISMWQWCQLLSVVSEYVVSVCVSGATICQWCQWVCVSDVSMCQWCQNVSLRSIYVSGVSRCQYVSVVSVANSQPILRNFHQSMHNRNWADNIERGFP